MIEEIERNLCTDLVGKVGFLERCCSIHQWEYSGYGNQLLQAINAIRYARENSCDFLCLPYCRNVDSTVIIKNPLHDWWPPCEIYGDVYQPKTKQCKLEVLQCGLNSMWHTEDTNETLHIAAALDWYDATIEIGPSIPFASDVMAATAIDGSPTAVGTGLPYTSCIDGAPTGMGWPYCFPSALQWPQARSDMAQALSKVFEPLPEDELVMHVRSGDSIEHQRVWMSANAFSSSPFDDGAILNPPVQPSCQYHLDVALRGLDGKPFRKVHLLADGRFECLSSDDKSESCNKTNPCIAILQQQLANGVLVLQSPQMDSSAAFARDTSLMARATSIATTCSTFSILGRLTSPHVQRLFVPDCKLSLKFANGQAEFIRDPWSFTSGGRTFSQDELRSGSVKSISWYSFPWAQAAAIEMAFSEDLAASTGEWEVACLELFTDIGYNKTVYTFEPSTQQIVISKTIYTTSGIGALDSPTSEPTEIAALDLIPGPLVSHRGGFWIAPGGEFSASQLTATV